MKQKLIAVMIAGWMMAQGASALPLNLLNDTVNYSSGIHATPNWDNNGTWLSWNIVQTENSLWRYEYVWHTDGRDLSHIIIEVTEGAALSDFSNFEYLYSGVESDSPTVGWFSPDQGRSNPGMPGPLYGIKFDLSQDTPIFGFSFETWRSPVWGDFYAKDGRHGGNDTYAYNQGFALPDDNDGFHIAVPNGFSDTTRVPDGGVTVGLLGLAVLGLGLLRWRFIARA